MAADLENQTKAQAGDETSEPKDASPSKAAIERYDVWWIKNTLLKLETFVSSPEDKKAKALMFLVTGKRHMLVRDIPAAVSSLGEACELLSAVCGETSGSHPRVHNHTTGDTQNYGAVKWGISQNVMHS